MTKHTPGPLHCRFVLYRGEWICGRANTDPVEVPLRSVEDAELWIPNRLIAAAPDLLEALRDLAMHDDICEVAGVLMDKAEAAIAKTERKE